MNYTPCIHDTLSMNWLLLVHGKPISFLVPSICGYEGWWMCKKIYGQRETTPRLVVCDLLLFGLYFIHLCTQTLIFCERLSSRWLMSSARINPVLSQIPVDNNLVQQTDERRSNDLHVSASICRLHKFHGSEHLWIWWMCKKINGQRETTTILVVGDLLLFGLYFIHLCNQTLIFCKRLSSRRLTSSARINPMLPQIPVDNVHVRRTDGWWSNDLHVSASIFWLHKNKGILVIWMFSSSLLD